MAKKTAAPNGNSLVIVESPAKARTIAKFLGRGYTVEASIGHIRDLPKKASDLKDKELQKEEWAYLGVNVNEGFEPHYIVPADKSKQVSKLKELLKGATSLYLATDEDREGEAISWHLQEVLKPKVPVHRMVFHEITEEAIHEALANPRQIDANLVQAQETRRILDRLYGYPVSQLLWRKVKPKLSAGRVQSVAVRLIVQRERERIAFRSASWWDLLGLFSAAVGSPFQAELVTYDGKRIPLGKDFDPATGKIKDASLLHLNEDEARALLAKLKGAAFTVKNLEERKEEQRPSPPFTTSTLQQEANRKLGFSSKETMRLAQQLYENGYITYMRTDSTTLASVAVDAARDLVRSEYGNDYLPAQSRVYASKVKNAQEAHEAIRPAGHPFKLPETLRSELDPQQFRLFDLIWKRTIASQMKNAELRRITLTIEGGGGVFRASGKVIDFPGFLRAYVEGSDDPEAELADRETLLPAVKPGDRMTLQDLQAKGHATQPPDRFTEASLTAELEKRGIGRPSTYASIIEKITREYVNRKGKALLPTWLAFSVVRLLEDHLPNLIDYDFTAQMEEVLDAISRGEENNVRYLKEFYFGQDEQGLKHKLEEKIKEVDAKESSRFPLGTPETGLYREAVFVRVGRYGPYIEQGDRKASIQEDMPPDEITLEKALSLLEESKNVDTPLGTNEEGLPVFVKKGRFGPYVQLGIRTDDGEKPKMASLLPNMVPADVTLEQALKLLELPRTVGKHPDSGEPIIATNGRYGPYIKCGTETRSLPADVPPTTVSLAQSLELLAQPKQRGRGRAAPKEPIKTFEKPSPVTQQPIKLLDGRYGHYVTDGTTNASLPRGTSPEELTFEQALALLEARALVAPAPKAKRKAAKKTAKKAAKKKG